MVHLAAALARSLIPGGVPVTDARSGYLLLADISGYTAFLNDSELEHARDTLSDLLGSDRAGEPVPVLPR